MKNKKPERGNRRFRAELENWHKHLHTLCLSRVLPMHEAEAEGLQQAAAAGEALELAAQTKTAALREEQLERIHHAYDQLLSRLLMRDVTDRLSERGRWGLEFLQAAQYECNTKRELAQYLALAWYVAKHARLLRFPTSLGVQTAAAIAKTLCLAGGLKLKTTSH